MIRLLLTSCLLFLAMQLSAQIRWERTYAGPNDDVCQVRETPDGGFIFIGSQGFSYYLVRTDSVGDTLWTRRPNWADFCGLINTRDGGFLLTGVTATNIRDFVANKFDANGDSLWARVYRDSLDQGHYTALETDDGGFLISGYTTTLSNSYDMFVVRTNPLGNELWRRTYGTPNFDLGAMPARNRNKGFIFATTTNSGGPSEFLVYVTDELGQVLWTRTYAATDAIGGVVPTALSDGGYLLTGWTAKDNYNTYLLRLDSAGNPLWDRDYGGTGFESRTSAGAVEDVNGGYTFVSSTDKSYGPGTDRDIALVRVDSLGNVLRQIRIGGTEEDMPRFFQQTADGGYIVTGYTLSNQPGWKEIYLVRLDSAGCGERFFDLGVSQFDTLCGGDTLWLDAGPGFSSYTWSTGATTQSLPITASDTYYVATTDSNNCQYYSSLVFVTAIPEPSFNFVNQGNFLVDFFGAPSQALSWTWDFGDGQSGSGKNPTHVFPRAGTFLVCLTADVPGCGLVTTCDTVVLAGLGLETQSVHDLLEVRYYSAQEQIEVKAIGHFEPGYWTLRDAWGRTLRREAIVPGQVLEVSTRGLPAGIYHHSLEVAHEIMASDKLSCW